MPARAAAREALDERIDAGSEHHVGVAHQRHRDARRERTRDLEHAATFAPAASARVPAAWITGPSASGSE